MFKTAAIKNEKDVVKVSKTSYAKKLGEINPYAQSVDKGGWIRIPQKDGTFKFKWNNEVEDQYNVNDQLGNGETYLGKQLNIKAANGESYRLLKDGICRIYKNGKLADQVDPIAITAKEITPSFDSGAYDNKKLIKGDVYENIRVEARFNIPNLSPKEIKNLKIIQVVYSPDVPHREDLGQLGGKLAFVDGGIKSAKKRPEPWYGYQDDLKGYNYKKTLDTNGAKITLSDFPGALMRVKGQKEDEGFKLRVIDIDQPTYTQLNFESYIVIADYNLTCKIRIIGVVKWGFNNDNWKITKTIVDPKMIATDQFSAKAQEIWDNDYGDNPEYEIFKSK